MSHRALQLVDWELLYQVGCQCGFGNLVKQPPPRERAVSVQHEGQPLGASCGVHSRLAPAALPSVAGDPRNGEETGHCDCQRLHPLMHHTSSSA